MNTDTRYNVGTDYEKDLDMFSGWTPEQTLEKMRLQNENFKLQTFADILKSASAMIDQESRIVVEKAIAEAIRNLSQKTVSVCLKLEKSDVESDDEIISIKGDETTETSVEVTTMIEPEPDTPSDDVHLFPQQPKKKMGRPPRVKTRFIQR